MNLPELLGFLERPASLQIERRSDVDAALLLQGWTLELTETYGTSIVHDSFDMTRKNGNAPDDTLNLLEWLRENVTEQNCILRFRA
jgi:hypothetical protein